MPFDDTTAIVTGGVAGLGLAITEALAARGGKVAIFDIAAEQIDSQVDRLHGEGAKVAGYDVTCPAEARSKPPSRRSARTRTERHPGQRGAAHMTPHSQHPTPACTADRRRLDLAAPHR